MRSSLCLAALFLCLAAGTVACGDDDGADPVVPANDGSVPAVDAGNPLAAVDARAPMDATVVVDASGPSTLLDATLGTRPRSDASAGSSVACVDESFARLNLFEAPSPGAITEKGTQPGVFESVIDATGGGLNVNQSYVYARFTDKGLEKLSLGDEDAFASDAWHISLRRYVVRTNSGVSGPGKVHAARTAPDTKFDTLTSVPASLAYRTEEYFTKSCEFVPDTSGIGAPATALSSFWSYAGCLAMTNNVFVVELPGGRHVKLQVLEYYPADIQKMCNETGKLPAMSNAGNYRVKWAFLD